MTSNTSKKLAGTPYQERAEDFIFLTKRIRIPKSRLLDVRPARDGVGAYVVTDRGALLVCEDYSAIIRELLPGAAPSLGANVGAALDRAGTVKA
jgi:hypothetical protein